MGKKENRSPPLRSLCRVLRFLSSFPRKLRGNHQFTGSEAGLGPKSANSRQIPGILRVYLENPIPGKYLVFCRFPRFRLRFCHRPALRLTQGNSRVARMELETPSGFPEISSHRRTRVFYGTIAGLQLPLGKTKCRARKRPPSTDTLLEIELYTRVGHFRPCAGPCSASRLRLGCLRRRLAHAMSCSSPGQACSERR